MNRSFHAVSPQSAEHRIGLELSVRLRRGFIPKQDAERREALAREPGASKSRLLAVAWAAWLRQRGTDEVEEKFSRRLDRISNQLARTERDGHLSIDSHALFIRYMVTVNAPLFERDETAQAIGRDR